MTWTAVLALAAGAWGFKALGLFGLGSRPPAGFDAVVGLIPAALFGAIVAVETFGDGDAVTVDARLVGLAAAVVASWRRAPFVVVVAVAMAATALTRAL